MAIPNGTSSADYKVPGGKLLRISVTAHEGVIMRIQLNGDYFMHPESAIEDIEMHLVGVPLERDILEQTLSNYINEHDIEIIGADAPSIVHTVFLALDAGRVGSEDNH